MLTTRAITYLYRKKNVDNEGAQYYWTVREKKGTICLFIDFLITYGEKRQRATRILGS